MFNDGWSKEKLLAFSAHCGKLCKEKRLPIEYVFDEAKQSFQYEKPEAAIKETRKRRLKND